MQPPLLPRRALLWLLVVEGLFLGLFFLLLALGFPQAAAAALAAPVQLLLWVILADRQFAILVFFAVVVPLAFSEMLPPLYHYSVFYHGTAVLLVITQAGRHLSSRREPQWRLSRWELAPVVIIGIWIFLSCVNAILRGWANRMMLSFTVFNLELLLIGCFFAVVPHEKRQVKTIVNCLIAGTVLMALLIPFLPAPIGEGGILGGKLIVTPFSIFNLNHFGGVVACMAMVISALLITTERTRARVILPLLLLPLLVTLVLTKSRGAWLGFGLGFVYLVVRARSLRLMLLAAFIGLLFLSSSVVRYTLFIRAAETSARDPSLAGRLLLWKYAWDLGRKNWLLGVGQENFRHVKHLFGFPLPRWHSFKYNSHNLFLEHFVNLGVVGLLCFLWLVVGSWRKYNRLARARDPDIRGWGLGFAAAIVVLLGHGLVDSYLFVHGVAALLTIIIGLSVALNRIAAATTEA